MAALYRAQSGFITAKTKLIEMMRKVRGESDRIDMKHTGTVDHKLSSDPEIMAAENELLKLVAKKESDA